MKKTKLELINILQKSNESTHKELVLFLNDKENENIYSKEFFPLLWSIIGVVDINSLSNDAQHKIWQSLKQSIVLERHDKGILGSYNKELATKYPEIPFICWKKLDNYEASEKFNQDILWEILKNNSDLVKEVAPHCLNGVKLVESLANKQLIPQLEFYLEKLRGQGASCGMSGSAILAVYEKEAVLKKLCDIISNSNRPLNIKEKQYLYYYLHEAYIDGFDATHIGLDDAMLSRLMVDEELEGLSELEVHNLLEYNLEIAEFSKNLDKIDGFCEQTAAKLIRHDKSHQTAMVERCLAKISEDRKPKGILLALELVNLNQIKTAITILIELAKKGSATELCYFLHRILPKMNGAEKMLMKILKLNLNKLHLDKVIAGNINIKEYFLRIHLNAVKIFKEFGLSKEASELLNELVSEGWFLGLPEFVDEFRVEANNLIKMDNTQATMLCTSAKKLHLKIYTKDGEVIISTADKQYANIDKEFYKSINYENKKDNINNKIEDKVKVIDDNKRVLSQPFKEEINLQDEENNITSIEKVNVERVEEKAIEKETITQIEIPTTETTKHTSEEVTILAPKEVIENNIKEDIKENIEQQTTPETVVIDAKESEILQQKENNVAQTEEVKVEPVEEIKSIDEVVLKDEKETKIEEEDLSENKANDVEKLSQLLNILEENNDNEEVYTKDSKSEEKSITRFLNINQKDMDKHFDKIKKITQIASQRAEKLKEHVENIDISSSKSVKKIRDIAKKISIFKKK